MIEQIQLYLKDLWRWLGDFPRFRHHMTAAEWATLRNSEMISVLERRITETGATIGRPLIAALSDFANALIDMNKAMEGDKPQ